MLRREQPVFIVMNAGSGHQDVEASRAAIRDVLTAAGQRHEFLLAEKPDDIHRLAREAVRRACEEDGVVAAAGGDGTINAVVQEALPSGRPFAVLPQGTFNYFGRCWGISQVSAESAQALLSARLRPVQIGLVNDRVFLVNASLGWYPKVLEQREVYKKRFGRSRLIALWAAVVTMLRLSGWLNLLIEYDDGRRLLRTPTLFVGNNVLQLQQVGVEDATAVEQGRLMAVTVVPIGMWKRFSLMLRGMVGKLSSADEVQSFPFHRLTIHTLGIGSRSTIKVAVDGEVLRIRLPVVFSVAPQPLMLFVPDPEAASEPAASA